MPKSDRKGVAAPPPIITRGHIVVDREAGAVTVSGTVIHLTPKQALLLWTLMAHPDQVLSREALMRQVWNTDFTGDTRTLEVHIHWLRTKIEPNPSRPIYLRTVRGKGYVFGLPEVDMPAPRLS